MKKDWYIYILAIGATLVLGISQFTNLKYDIDIIKYLKYSRDFTQGELEVLKKYDPLVYGGNINDPPLGIYYEESGQYIGLMTDHIGA